MAAGVKVTTGTDEGGWAHGNNAHEIGLLVNAGMTPTQAITAATTTAAQCLGLQAEIGRIAEGLHADLILVEGDPLKDVTILEQGKAVQLVMKAGEIYLDRRNNQPQAPMN